MTFSNRIPLAGAIPVLVVLALAALVAAIAFGSTQRASAVADNDACDISPVVLDMLLDRYGLDANDCDTLNLFDNDVDGGDGADAHEFNSDDHELNTWDFSDQGLTSFAITDDDAAALKKLTGEALDTDGDGTGTVVEKSVNYIDLTGNPLSIDDVSLANLPTNVALKITVDSNVAGFQTAELILTEGKPGYIGIAIPGQRDTDKDDAATDADDRLVALTVTLDGGEIGDDVNAGVAESGDYTQLVKFGDGAAATRTLELDSESERIAFYIPIQANKDNLNDEEWGFDIAIDRESDANTNLTDGDDFSIDEIAVTVLDADAPVNDDDARSEDVVAAIESAVGDGTSTGGHLKFDDLTLRDLGTITALIVRDADADYIPAGEANAGDLEAGEDQEALEELFAGDFEGLVGLRTLHLVGAGSLPTGIFAGAGSKAEDADGDASTVTITFAANKADDEDVEEVGNYRTSTLPAHIFADQEKRQVIVLSDDTNDDDEGTTSGLDAGLYASEEEGNFFVTTNALTTYYVLGNKVEFGTTEIGQPTLPAAFDRGAGKGKEGSKVIRFAISTPDSDPEKDGGRTDWLFLFSVANPDNAGDLLDIAVVEISEND